MEVKKAFGTALKAIRVRQALTQEDFSVVSSRTFLSSLERGLKGVTLEKVDELASVLKVHPLTLIAACYLHKDPDVGIETLFDLVQSELNGHHLPVPSPGARPAKDAQ